MIKYFEQNGNLGFEGVTRKGISYGADFGGPKTYITKKEYDEKSALRSLEIINIQKKIVKEASKKSKEDYEALLEVGMPKSTASRLANYKV